MATFNGASFLREQLASMLCQLGADDEIVIVDDASTDDSVAVARQMAQSAVCPITIVEHTTNRGHVRAFERALSEASRDVLVVADQDDVWLPDYIATIRQTFRDDLGAGLVVARPIFSDQHLDELPASNQRYRHPRRGGLFGVVLFLLNRSMPIGCTMSLRSRELAYLLPFPHDALAHDHWMFAMASLRNRMRSIDHEAILYRRHPNVFTKKRPPVKMVASRLRLIGLLARESWLRRGR